MADLDMPPSEYFKRQCYVSFEPEEWNLASCAEWLGPDRVLWASDYPHPEYHPGILKEVQEAVAPLAEADRRKVLGESAVAAYDLAVAR